MLLSANHKLILIEFDTVFTISWHWAPSPSTSTPVLLVPAICLPILSTIVALSGHARLALMSLLIGDARPLATPRAIARRTAAACQQTWLTPHSCGGHKCVSKRPRCAPSLEDLAGGQGKICNVVHSSLFAPTRSLGNPGWFWMHRNSGKHFTMLR